MAKRAERHPWDRVKRSPEVARPEVPPGPWLGEQLLCEQDRSEPVNDTLGTFADVFAELSEPQLELRDP
jgi:hypothetical protein